LGRGPRREVEGQGRKRYQWETGRKKWEGKGREKTERKGEGKRKGWDGRGWKNNTNLQFSLTQSKKILHPSLICTDEKILYQSRTFSTAASSSP